MANLTLNELALLAQAGDIGAVEQLLKGCQARVLSICRRMLRGAADADDAAQEILIKIITSLGSFRGEADFLTWAQRIAVNHVRSLLRNTKAEAQHFERLARDLQLGLQFGAAQSAPSADEQLLAYEVYVACAQRMLHCLDAPNRLALVLVDICNLNHTEAAAVLDIGDDALRQRLSRARRELADFLSAQCGLANPSAPCRCRKQVPAALAVGNVRREQARADAPGIDSLATDLQGLKDLTLAIRFLRQLPQAEASHDFVDAIRKLLGSEQYRALH